MKYEKIHLLVTILLSLLSCGSPANTPPANTPPANTPPANTPPANTPPANTTPAITPIEGPIPINLRPNNYNFNLVIGDIETFYLIAEYSDGTIEDVYESFTPISDNTNTATVSGRSITAVEMGTAYITSNFRGVETTITVNVTPNRNLKEYRVSIENITLKPGEKAGINLQEVYDDGFIKNIKYDVTYSTDNSDVVTLLNNNIVAVSNGSATINLRYIDTDYPVNVTVSSSSSLKNNRTYIFGHSLIHHERNINPIPSDETSMPHWMYELSREAGENFTSNGQYGFLRTHDNLPPDSQWGFDRVPGGWREYWDSEEAFADADFDSVLLTAGNFIQSNNPDEYYDSGEEISPLTATENIFNWVIEQEPGIKLYIYENWETMSRASVSKFPPTPEQLAIYHLNNSFANINEGDFHRWWLDYQDLLLENFDNVKMIPVGPILSNLFTGVLSDIPVEILYEDEAPHGRPTTYFLAAMITYMAMNETNAPSTYMVPDDIHYLVRDNYNQIITTIWDNLQSFNFDSGESRVFY